MRTGGEKTTPRSPVTLNGGQTRTVQVTPENFDVVQMQVALSDVNPGAENLVEMKSEGQGNLMYQVTAVLPAVGQPGQISRAGAGSDLVTIDVAYDRTELAVDDTVQVKVTVSLNQPAGGPNRPWSTWACRRLQRAHRRPGGLMANYKDTPA